jgi:hypothetical protein
MWVQEQQIREGGQIEQAAVVSFNPKLAILADCQFDLTLAFLRCYTGI